MDELLTDLTARPAATAGDYAAREGFDENLLGVPVPLPSLAGVETVLLPYTHFSVRLRTDKRLAAVTRVGIDGGTLMDLDPRRNSLEAGSTASGRPTGGGSGSTPGTTSTAAIWSAGPPRSGATPWRRPSRLTMTHFTKPTPAAGCQVRPRHGAVAGHRGLPPGTLRPVPQPRHGLHRPDLQRPRSGCPSPVPSAQRLPAPPGGS